MNKPKVRDYILLHIVIIIYSLGAIASKGASQQEFLSIKFILLYGFVLVSLGIYAVLWQQILKKMSLTTAFTNKAVTIIWGMLWGKLLFSEQITWNMIVGAIVVFLGVCLVVKADE